MTVLCYHKVGPAAEEGRWLNIEPARLSQHVRWFVRRGFRFVPASAPDFGPRTVCFTFDDAYVSTLANAVPIFEEYGRPATIFAVADRIGQSSVWDRDRARPLADWATLEWAADRGIEIGHHTRTHPSLPECTDPDAELAPVLAERFGLGALAYPYGHLNAAVQAAAARARYPVAYALGKRVARPTDPRLALPRIPVAYSDSLPLLLYRIWRARRRA